MFTNYTIAALAFTAASINSVSVSAASMPTGAWPTSKGTVTYSAVYTVKAGTTFDGGMKTYSRSDITCAQQDEGGYKDAVFNVEPGATLKNVIIGVNQREGVHCEKHDCVIENVWWNDVCEDALTIKGGSSSSVTKVIGGGAKNAEDKIIQHNGYGTVSIDGFYAHTFGKLYRSCGTCNNYQRKVTVSNVYAVNPTSSIVTVNKNFKDVATLSNIKISTNKKSVKVCAWSQGTTDGSEPTELGSGPSSGLCNYATSDVAITYTS